jgi:predicted component of type VI protein secretion system
MARLIIESADGRGREYPITGTVVIGRLKTNPIPIDDVKASREHAAIRAIGGDYYLTDLESRNGTLLNGEMIKGHVRLRHCDRVSIGGMDFRFVEDPADQALRDDLAAKAAASPPLPASLAPAPPTPSPTPQPPQPRRETKSVQARPEPTPVAASTGGPVFLERLLSNLIHLLLFVMSAFIAWWVTGRLIRSLLGS